MTGLDWVVGEVAGRVYYGTQNAMGTIKAVEESVAGGTVAAATA
jgi:hypothetical protein